jgi:uncharacterized protein (TIGR02679 family)
MTRIVDTTRLQRVFDKPELTRLVDRLRNRFQRGMEGAYLTLPNPDINERKAIAGLFGRPVAQGQSIRIAIADLEILVQKKGLAPDLRTAVEALRGPLRDLAGEKANERQAWQSVYEAVWTEVIELGMEDWLEKVRKDGLLKRLAKNNPHCAASLLRQALTVIKQLPGQGQTLSTLAANTLGDAHALDAGQPVATLVKRAIGQSDAILKDGDKDESERELWANAGILIGGALTSTVLVLNLPVEGNACSARIVDQARQDGQPIWLTLRQLVRDPPFWAVGGRTVYICENPAVVAEAADGLGSRCAPLVCTYGQPRAAVNHLLMQLRKAGAELAYHGDFDWPGITIANGIMRRFAAKPWHFDETVYRLAATEATMALKGKPVTAEWDPELTRAMSELGIAIPEERVLETLLETL